MQTGTEDTTGFEVSSKSLPDPRPCFRRFCAVHASLDVDLRGSAALHKNYLGHVHAFEAKDVGEHDGTLQHRTVADGPLPPEILGHQFSEQ